MSGSSVAIVAAVGVAIGIAVPARADESAARKELGAIYQQYTQAFQQKDTTALQQWVQRYVAPNAVNKNPDGTSQTRQQLLDNLKRAQARWVPPSQVSGKIESLRVKGNKAVVLFTDRSVRVVHSRRAPQQPHQFMLVSAERDTWVKTPAGWKSSLSENLRGQAFIDGKPVTPRRAPPKK
jgi:uncharacterized protein DUF4440